MNKEDRPAEAVIDWDALSRLAQEKSENPKKVVCYVVFINSKQIRETYHAKMIDKVSKHDNLKEAFKAYVQLRRENPSKHTAVVLFGDDNVVYKISPESIVLPNEDGSSVILVRDENGVDQSFHAEDFAEEWAIRKKLLMSQ